MTHDSIGLGEDGPTHQPVEHLAALRAIPQLLCVPPGRRGRDRRVLGAGAAAARRAVGAGADPPGAAAAAHRGRRGKPLGARRLCAGRGRRRAPGDAARDRLRGVARDGGARRARRATASRAAVVSMPCWELFETATEEYQRRGARHGAARRGRGRGALRLGPLARRRAAPLSAWTASAPRRPARRSSRISASPPKRSPRRPARSYRSAKAFGRTNHGGTGCDQRLRPHRPAGLARGLRAQAQRDRGRRRSTISARSRPTRICCDTTACTAAFRGEVTTGDNWMDIGRGKIRVTAERDPAKLPWRELGVDVALECTGIFTKREAAAKHLEAGAKRVIISAPADGADMTVVHGRQPRRAEARAPGHLERARARPIASRRSPMCCTRGSASSAAT